MNFREALKAEIERRGLTQEQTAAYIGCRQSEIYNYVSGKKNPSLIRIRPFADFLNLTTDEVLDLILVQK